MKLRLVLFVCLFVSLIAIASDYPPKRGETEIVEFPQIGKVKVEAIVRTHKLPLVTFTNSQGDLLLHADVGADFIDTHFSDPDDPDYAGGIKVGVRVVQVTGLPAPVVFAGAVTLGGTECTYGGQLFTERRGRIAPLSEPLPDVSDDGGYSIGTLRQGRGLELAVWNMIWGKGEAHVDPHNHWVRIYRFNASSGRFEFVKKYIVPKPREVAFPNLLREIPDFGC